MKKLLLLFALLAPAPALAVWDVTTPLGTEAKSLGDNRIRELKTDIQTSLRYEGDFPGPDTTNPRFIWTPSTGTTAQRPSGSTNTAAGMLYINVSSGCVEQYNGSAWNCIDAVSSGSITSADLGANSVGNFHIIDSTITAADMGTDSVAADEIAASAVGTSEVNDNTLTSDDLAADSVSASELNATGVEAELEAVLDLNELQGQIGDAQVADGAIDGGTGGEIADGTITQADLGADSVAASEIEAEAVGTSEIANGSIGTADLSSAVLALFAPVSIQRSSGNLTWSSEAPGEKTANVTITSVDTNKSYVILNGYSSTDSVPSDCMGAAQLTSATNVQVRGHCFNNTAGSSSHSLTVYFTVVEWD